MIHEFARLGPKRRREEANGLLARLEEFSTSEIIVDNTSTVILDFDLNECNGSPMPKNKSQPAPSISKSPSNNQIPADDDAKKSEDDQTTKNTSQPEKSSEDQTKSKSKPKSEADHSDKHSKTKVDPDEHNRIPPAPVNIAYAWGRRCKYFKYLDRVQNMIASGSVPPHLFDECLNQGLAPLLIHTIETFKHSTLFELYVQLEDFLDSPITLRDFKLFRTLGRGTFGAVFAAQERQTHAVYAVKQISKKMVKSANKGYEWMVQNEQRMLKTMTSPYVLNLHASLDDEDYLYLIFDICTGGDLGFHLKNQVEHRFSLERARFYAAQVLLGLEHMHSHNIVYRDLKPSNIILDEDGNIKLSDLGLSIRLHPTKPLKHVAGTAGYWAPEILSKSGTYKSSDFWSFGVLLFEMIAGHRPILLSYFQRYERSVHDTKDNKREKEEARKDKSDTAPINEENQEKPHGNDIISAADGQRASISNMDVGPPSELHSDADRSKGDTLELSSTNTSGFNSLKGTKESSNVSGFNSLKGVKEEKSKKKPIVRNDSDLQAAQETVEEKSEATTNDQHATDNTIENTNKGTNASKSEENDKFDTKADDKRDKKDSNVNAIRGDRLRYWSPFSNSHGHDVIARDPDSILDVDIDYPSILHPSLCDLLQAIFNPDPCERLGAKGVEEIKNHPFFSSSINGLPPINWEALSVKDVIPPYKPEALKVHAHSVEQVGAFDEGRWRSVKLTDADNAHYAKWHYVNRNHREHAVALVLPLLKLDENGRVAVHEECKVCCNIM